MAVTLPMNADLRALWDERYGSDEPVRRRDRSVGAVYDYVIAAGLTLSGLSLAVGSMYL